MPRTLAPSRFASAAGRTISTIRSRRPSSASVSIVIPAPPALQPLPDDERHDREGGERVSPPPSERGVEHESGERREREPGAGDRLVGIGPESAAAERLGRPEFYPAEEGHDPERQRCENDPDAALAGFLAKTEQPPSGIDHDIQREGAQDRAGRSRREPLNALDPLGIVPTSTNESTPNAMSATEPASAPAVTAMMPSTTFQPTVTASRRMPRRKTPARPIRRAPRFLPATTRDRPSPPPWGACSWIEYATGERTRSGWRARVKLRHYRTPQLLDTLGVSMVPISVMTFGRMLILVLLAALVVVPPVAMASDHCAGMSHTCEAPCGASPCAVFPPLPVSMAPELVASIEAQPPGHLPASLFALLEPPPKPFPLSA